MLNFVIQLDPVSGHPYMSSILLELGREGADLAMRMEAFQILINSCKSILSRTPYAVS
jgi:hypothetical protein